MGQPASAYEPMPHQYSSVDEWNFSWRFWGWAEGEPYVIGNMTSENGFYALWFDQDRALCGGLHCSVDPEEVNFDAEVYLSFNLSFLRTESVCACRCRVHGLSVSSDKVECPSVFRCDNIKARGSGISADCLLVSRSMGLHTTSRSSSTSSSTHQSSLSTGQTSRSAFWSTTMRRRSLSSCWARRGMRA